MSRTAAQTLLPDIPRVTTRRQWRHQVRLILCDAQRMLLDVLAPALRDAGHVVSDACIEPDALPGLVADRQPEACLVESTYRGTPRLDVLAATRIAGPSTAIVVLTGQAGPAVWQAYDDGIVDGVVSKSGSFDEVLAGLCSARQGRGHVTGFARPSPVQPVAQGHLHSLTFREREVLDLLVEGLSTTAIADRLGVSKNTVRTHVASVLRKLRVHDRGNAVRSAAPLGLV